MKCALCECRPLEFSHSCDRSDKYEEWMGISKLEIQKMSVDQLPLQKGLSASNIALDDNIKAIILNSSDSENNIVVKAGLFYTGVVAGCNCSDDPSPVDVENEYCEVQLDINKTSGDATVTLLLD